MKEILRRLIANDRLSEKETCEVMINIAEGKYPAEQIAAMLAIMQSHGVTVDELLGFRRGLLETGLAVNLSPYTVLDIVGTGGDGKNTFNISTCSCFVLAGAGFKVAKHGNYASTSVSGAGNVLEEHGVKFTNDESKLKESLEKSGFTYMHAPLFAKGMKNVVPVRKALQVPTAFNMLGPLINPCRPQAQCLGTANFEQFRLYTNVCQALGINYAIVSSTDGYDEISLTSDFKVATRNIEKVYSPADFGMKKIDPKEIYGGSTKQEAMQIFDNVLKQEATEAQTNVVIANSAIAMRAADESLSIAECIDKATESLKSGKAFEALKKYVEVNS